MTSAGTVCNAGLPGMSDIIPKSQGLATVCFGLHFRKPMIEQVALGLIEQIRFMLKSAYGVVAGATEQAAYLAGVVTVVDRQRDLDRQSVV